MLSPPSFVLAMTTRLALMALFVQLRASLKGKAGLCHEVGQWEHNAPS